MKKLLYIGNNLNNKSSNLSSITTLGPLLESVGYQIRYASSKKSKILRLVDMIWSVLSSYKKVDVVIIDTYSTQNFYYALIVSQICRLLKLKYIPSLNGGDLPKRLEFSKQYSRLIFKYAYKLVSPSIYLKEAFEKKGYQKVYFVPNTIKIENYFYLERDFQPIKLLWVRSLSKIYNPSLAIQVLRQLQDEGMEVSLCMVGPDSEGSLKKLKKLTRDLKVSVAFTGKLSKLEWRGLSVNYNIFINTTNYDNMPVSVIEAMALGLPIVSTNVGGMPYLIRDGVDGLLVPSNDVVAFANAIKRVVNNPVATRSMALKARQKAEQFDWEVVKLQWFDVLK
jgi:glycosyltransferase involved in cell wall biosynthesis